MSAVSRHLLLHTARILGARTEHNRHVMVDKGVRPEIKSQAHGRPASRRETLCHRVREETGILRTVSLRVGAAISPAGTIASAAIVRVNPSGPQVTPSPTVIQIAAARVTPYSRCSRSMIAPAPDVVCGPSPTATPDRINPSSEGVTDRQARRCFNPKERLSCTGRWDATCAATSAQSSGSE